MKSLSRVPYISVANRSGNDTADHNEQDQEESRECKVRVAIVDHCPLHGVPSPDGEDSCNEQDGCACDSVHPHSTAGDRTFEPSVRGDHGEGEQSPSCPHHPAV